MFQVTEDVIYDAAHDIEIIHNGSHLEESRPILIRISKAHHYLKIKVRDLHDFSFNFVSYVDSVKFEKMKMEQHLEISHEEFNLQLIALLRQTLSEQMLLRFDLNGNQCQLVFYEKSKIKCLIFLVLEMHQTKQEEIINEMSENILQLKELNKNVSSQLDSVKRQLQEKETVLDVTQKKSYNFEKQICKDIKIIEGTFLKAITKIERDIGVRIENLNRKHVQLLNNLDAIKAERRFKENAFSQSLRQLEYVRRENEGNLRIIDKLREEIKELSFEKTQGKTHYDTLLQDLYRKDKEIETLNAQIAVVQKDIHEATMIIAQKTKMYDEIAGDLVQANTMIVNFTNRYDSMSNEIEQLHASIVRKDKMLEEQMQNFNKLSIEFVEYKLRYRAEEWDKLNQELFKSKQTIDNLEKLNRETTKVNGLLTKKLANGEGFDMRNNTHWLQPK